ncbi:hypothetical protein CEP54_005178 [Fusarium duplospermum]|uniref:J domain-containing protein n=1 Tax=Fusarium duplospermum TaxID=1325734 RepID=A0A428QE30_9HYPO|nr:hypothetical protein CEP54_005178 [Fusarium duplospermum]
MSTRRPFTDPYRTLGVSNDATLEEIRLAHRDLVLQHHPDRFPGKEGKFTAQRKFQSIQDAYETLRDPEAREKYDLIRLWGLDRTWKTKSPNNSNTLKLGSARPKGILVARGYINGQDVNAIPDTGASCNIVSYSYAKQLGFERLMPESPDEELRMANGKLLRTIGRLRATWQFSTDPELSWDIIFLVLEDFIYDLVLGNEFLRASATMAQNKRRLSRIPRPLRALSVLYVNNLGPVNQRLLGTMNGELVEALPDSGSEPNLVSMEYAMRQGWRDKTDWADVRLLQFANGAVEKTMGSLAVTWKLQTPLGDGSLEEGITVLFHILYGCVYDAILGEDVLTATDAFSKHQESFIDVDAPPGPSGLNLVIWLQAKDQVKAKDQRMSPPELEPSGLSDPRNSYRSPVSNGLQRSGAIRHRDSSSQRRARHHLYDPDDVVVKLERRAAAERKAWRKTHGIESEEVVDAHGEREQFKVGVNRLDGLSRTDSSEGVDTESRNTSSSTDITDPATELSTRVEENSSADHDSTLVASPGDNTVGEADDNLGVCDPDKALNKDLKRGNNISIPSANPSTTDLSLEIPTRSSYLSRKRK